MKYIRQILVISEETEFLKSIKRHLRREGFLVNSTSSEYEARLRIKNDSIKFQEFDLTIIDASLDNFSSTKLIKWIRSHYPKISIIVISGFGGIDLIKEAIRVELDDYCQKPLTPNQMMEMINNVDRKKDTRQVTTGCC